MYSYNAVKYMCRLIEIGNAVGCIPVKTYYRSKKSHKIVDIDNLYLKKRKRFLYIDLFIVLFLIIITFLDHHYPEVLNQDLVIKYYVYLGTLLYPFQVVVDSALYEKLDLIVACANAFLHYFDQMTICHLSDGKRMKRPIHDDCSSQQLKLYMTSVISVTVALLLSFAYFDSIVLMAELFSISLTGSFYTSILPQQLWLGIGIVTLIGNTIAVVSLGLRFNLGVTLLLLALNYGEVGLNIARTLAKDPNPKKQQQFVSWYRTSQVCIILLDSIMSSYLTVIGVCCIAGQVVCGIAVFGNINVSGIVKTFALYMLVCINIVCTIGMNGAGKLTSSSEELLASSDTVTPNLAYMKRFRKSSPPIQIFFKFGIPLNQNTVVEMDAYIADKIIGYALTV